MDDAELDAWCDAAIADAAAEAKIDDNYTEGDEEPEYAEDEAAQEDTEPVEEIDLGKLKKEDYAFVARLRRLPHTAATLWKMTTVEMAKLFTPAPREKAAVRDLQLKRAQFVVDNPGVTVDKLKTLMRQAGLTCTTGISRGGMIDALAENGPPPPPLVLDADQAAFVARHAARRLLVHAGPGSGKTTSLCHLVKKILEVNPKARVLVLAFNRVAEEVLAARLKLLQAPRIPSTRIMDQAAAGAAIMTFDKFGYRINLYCGNPGNPDDDVPLPDDSYQQALDRALARMRDPTRDLPLWDAVVVDEGQDIKPTYAAITDALGLMRGAGGHPHPQMFAAGDPRQELYSGARWFSDLWAAAPAREKTVLRFNHRSAAEIVAAMNAFSRANFPLLHVDQIAARPAGGLVQLHVVEAKAGWHFDRTGASARALGERVGHLVAEGAPGKCYAISPVTLGKFGLEAATCAARQIVAERRPGVLVHAGDSGEGDVACAGVYTIATSKKIKGTERERVVVFGIDVDFTIAVDRPSLVKLVFVAISRAADELVLVSRRHPHELLAEILKPVTDLLGGGLTAAPPRARPRALPTINVAGTGGVAGSQGLCSSPAVPAVVGSTDRSPVLDLGAAHGDEDFLGVYAEALVAHALGVPLATAVDVRPERAAHLRGFGREEGGRYVLRTDPGSVAALRAVVAEVAALPGTAAYVHAMLKYSCLVGRAWTVSDRLRATAARPTEAAGNVAAWLLGAAAVDPAKAAVAYLVRGAEQLVSVRAVGAAGNTSGNSADPGLILYEADLVIDKLPVELKYVAALTDEHRRQAAIYACLLGAPRALLVNLRRGVAEWVATAPHRLVTSVARATLALREARSRAIGPLRQQTVAPPAGLNTGCVISLDTEYDEAGTTLEFSAVAASLDDWSVLGVFDVRHPGVAEVTDAAARSAESKKSGGKPDVYKLTGLKREGARDVPLAPGFTRTAHEAFRRWCDGLPLLRTFVHWGGQERALTADGASTMDVLHKVFRPWLHANNAPREKLTTLASAAAQVMPQCAFAPHRAFEDAVAALTVLVATTDFSSRL